VITTFYSLKMQITDNVLTLGLSSEEDSEADSTGIEVDLEEDEGALVVDEADSVGAIEAGTAGVVTEEDLEEEEEGLAVGSMVVIDQVHQEVVEVVTEGKPISSSLLLYTC
jgi:hypothetical protein